MTSHHTEQGCEPHPKYLFIINTPVLYELRVVFLAYAFCVSLGCKTLFTASDEAFLFASAGMCCCFVISVKPHALLGRVVCQTNMV